MTSVTPSDEAVDVERIGLLEDGDGETSVQVERLDKHPRRVGDQRVVDDRRQRLAHPVLSVSTLLPPGESTKTKTDPRPEPTSLADKYITYIKRFLRNLRSAQECIVRYCDQHVPS